MRRHSLLGLLMVLSWGMAWGHPAQVTLAEVELDSRRGWLEVSLRIDPTDLARALAGAGTASPPSERLAELVRRHFRVLVEGEALPVHWVGSEVEVAAAWLYFELPLAARPAALRIENSLLFEQHPGQVNTVNVRVDGLLTTLHLRREHPAGVVELPEP